jgi:hypothetical protein
MSTKLYHAFQQCLERVQSGVPLEECVAQYPEHAPELRLLLQSATAPAGPEVGNMPAAARARVRQRVMGHWDRTRRPRRSWFLGSWFPGGTGAVRWAIAAAAFVLLLTLGGGFSTVAAAQHALPGASLYSVKQFREEARLWLTRSPEEKVAIYSDYARERVREMHRLEQTGQGPAAAVALSRLEEHLYAVDRLMDEAPPAAPLVQVGRQAIIEVLDRGLGASQQVSEDGPAVLEESPPGAYPCVQHTMQAINQARQQVQSALESVGGALPDSPGPGETRIGAFCPP